ncbi:peptide-methionine (R)-S-oxide reductase MsrB [Marinobacteraceae bacterium S3BR75-40.1]
MQRILFLISLWFVAWGALAASKYAPDDPSLKVATFAGGCFWCVEAGYEKIPGVVEAVSGFSGGDEKNPTYEEVSSGQTGHTESVQVYYDPTKITYNGLVHALWRMMDPTDPDGQFVDRGSQYRPAIFYHNEHQKRVAERAKAELQASGRYDKPVVISIEPFKAFYPAEGYHQNYYKENPIRYKFYTFNSGRYQFVEKIWGENYELDYSKYQPKKGEAGGEAMDQQSMNGKQPWKNFEKPGEAELKKQLSPMVYDVTQEDGTEPAYKNAYWDEKRAGLYVDVVSGEPLFSSSDKYKSGTGWPSFVRPIEPNAVVTREDNSWFMSRTEVRSRIADSHLGHVFEDGPPPTGLRYCMNSAALRFIPKADMAEAGYGDYLDQVGPPMKLDSE